MEHTCPISGHPLVVPDWSDGDSLECTDETLNCPLSYNAIGTSAIEKIAAQGTQVTITLPAWKWNHLLSGCGCCSSPLRSSVVEEIGQRLTALGMRGIN